MAGFFQNILDRIFGKPPVPPPPPPPPPPPGDGGGGADLPPEQPNDFQRIWNEHTTRSTLDADSRRTGYSHQELFQAHLETFLSLPGMIDDPDRMEYWASYVETFVSGHGVKKEWLRELGYDARDYDWQEWRETKGYRARNRK